MLDRDISRIHRANVHLMPDHTIPSEETGTRHRTADRVAKQTGAPVISVSQSMQIIAIYVGEIRYVLEDSGSILARANQALATLERYKVRLDEVSSTLSALEIEDLVTVRDVAVVAQRLEMVSRIAREIDDYVNELGTDGRLLSLQLEELVTGVEAERELVVRDYQSGGTRTQPAEEVLAELEAPLPRRPRRHRRTSPGPSASARASTSTARSPRAATACWPRCPRLPDVRRRPAGRALRDAAEAALGQRRGPADWSTASASCAPAACARASPGWPSPASSSATSSTPSLRGRAAGCRLAARRELAALPVEPRLRRCLGASSVALAAASASDVAVGRGLACWASASPSW